MTEFEIEAGRDMTFLVLHSAVQRVVNQDFVTDIFCICQYLRYRASDGAMIEEQLLAEDLQ
jgi:hypothetical protein